MKTGIQTKTCIENSTIIHNNQQPKEDRTPSESSQVYMKCPSQANPGTQRAGECLTGCRVGTDEMRTRGAPMRRMEARL